eukprot:scaffold576_cov260-Pinguiococcus_pyrenoidosus.AAC.67
MSWQSFKNGFQHFLTFATTAPSNPTGLPLRSVSLRCRGDSHRSRTSPFLGGVSEAFRCRHHEDSPWSLTRRTSSNPLAPEPRTVPSWLDGISIGSTACGPARPTAQVQANADGAAEAAVYKATRILKF